MAALIQHPLLQGDDLIGAVIFFVIWIVIALLNQVGKWQEKKRKQQQLQVPPSPPTAEPVRRKPQQPQPIPGQRSQQPMPGQRPQQPVPGQRPQRPAPPRQRMREQPARRPPQAPPQPPRPIPVQAPPVVDLPTYESPATLSTPSVVLGEIGSATEARMGPKVLAVSMRDLRGSLQPASLRKQMVLLEVLQRPLALRSEQLGEL